MIKNDEAKKKEMMDFLNEKVFEPIKNAPNVPGKIRSGVALTIARMNKLNAEQMREYFWSAIRNRFDFPKSLEDNNLPSFEDVYKEFREKFDDKWLKS
jgi:hypothetical protein